MTLKKRAAVWREVLHDTRGTARESVVQRRLEALEVWRKERWTFLGADDIPEDPEETPRQIWWTVDEAADFKTDKRPVKPFPRHREYLRLIDQELWRYRILLFDKARQMFMSSFLCLELFHRGAFHEEQEIIVSKTKKEGAEKLINDKIRTPWRRLPEWLKLALPLDERPYDMLTFGNTGSTITAVAQNFADADRGITASIVMIDEAAYQPEYPAIMRAIMPMATRAWALTSANLGNPGADLFHELCYEGESAAKRGVLEVPFAG